MRTSPKPITALLRTDQQVEFFASREKNLTAIRFRSIGAVGLYWVYRKPKGKDDSDEKIRRRQARRGARVRSC